jgi:hypothetical protein
MSSKFGRTSGSFNWQILSLPRDYFPEVAFGETSNSHHIRWKPAQGHLPEARFSFFTPQARFQRGET